MNSTEGMNTIEERAAWWGRQKDAGNKLQVRPMGAAHYISDDRRIFDSTCHYRLAPRKPRVGKLYIPNATFAESPDAVELIPGMVVLERMPTEDDVQSMLNRRADIGQGGGLVELHRDVVDMLNSLRVDIDE